MRIHFIRILIFFLLLTACMPQPTPAQKPPPPPDELQQPEVPLQKAENETPAALVKKPAAALPDVIEIIVDGQPEDWDAVPVWAVDEERETQTANPDILAVKALHDEQNLFFMVSLAHMHSENFLIVLDLAGKNGEKILLEFFPISQDAGRLGLFAQNGHFIESLPTPTDANSDLENVIEYRIALPELLEIVPYLVSPVKLNAVSVRSYACADQNGCTSDELKISAEIPAVKGAIQTTRGNMLRLCQPGWENLSAEGSLTNAGNTINVPRGYAAEWLVPPTGFNMPIELINYADEEYYVLSSRESMIYALDLQGNTRPLFNVINGTSAVVDENGHIFLYDYVRGGIYDISPKGEMRKIAESRELEWDGTSKLIYGEDGHLYFTIETCLYKMDKSGKFTCIAELEQPFFQFYQTRDKRLIGLGWNTGHLIDWEDFSSQQVFTIPNMHGPTYNALTSDDQGNIYISTGSQIFKVDPDYQVSLLSTLEVEGLSGIEWVKQTNEIIGGEHRNGGIMAVHAESGAVRRLVAGNGLISPIAMAVSACGEIAVSNDDGNNVTLIAPDGSTHYWFNYLSYTPPTPHLLSTDDNRLYVAEDEVGNQGRHELHIVPPEGVPVKSRLTGGLPDMTACGIGMNSQGNIFYTQPFDGTFNQLDDTQRKIIAEGFTFPQAFTVAPQGGFYLLAGGQPINELMPAPFSAGELYHMQSNGEHVKLADTGGMDIVLSPNDQLFVTDGDSVFQVEQDGRRGQFAHGFLSPGGIVFDFEGSMIVSDIDRNAVVRISGFPSGTIEGTLRDASGNAAAGIEMRIFRTYPELAGRRALTDPEGNFSLKAAPGMYTVQVFRDGMETGIETTLAVEVDQTSEIELSLPY